jgi:hypothetical protein
MDHHCTRLILLELVAAHIVFAQHDSLMVGQLGQYPVERLRLLDRLG